MKQSGAGLVLDLFWDRFRSAARRDRLQYQRLQDLVKYARQHSPYYQTALAGLPEQFALSDLPIMTKSQIMAQFDQLVTDPQVSLALCQEFMQDPENRRRKLLDRYMIATTSGSTGEPLIAVLDSLALSLFVYMGSTRLIPSYRQFLKMLLKGFKIANIVSDQGFFMGNGSLHQNIARVKQPDKLMRVFDVLDPIDEIVAGLNDYQPLAMHSYPSFLELLCEEKKAGRLTIEPMMILCGGEKLRTEVRQEAEALFGVKVYGNYSCTEAGTLAYECTEQRLHINQDWLIVEPVDEHYQPVAPGVKSSKILITNLGNYILPFIRYEVSDQVIVLPERCACGKQSQCLLVEGREGETLRFFRPDGSVFKASYPQLLTNLKNIPDLNRFQLVLHTGPANLIEVRLSCSEPQLVEQVYQTVCQKLTYNLDRIKGPRASFQLSDQPPELNPRSGKFQAVYQVDGSSPA